MELNTQKPEKVQKVTYSKGDVEVHSVFSTIQGEGPFTGHPAVFVRLAGCNLQCPLCDTQYTDNRELLSPEEVVSRVLAAHTVPTGGLVVVSGGEPFRQKLGPLFQALCRAGFYVQVETNGTLALPQLGSVFNVTGSAFYAWDTTRRVGVYVVCSPKTGRIHNDLRVNACCFKYVACAGDIREEDGLPLTALGHVANPYLARPPEWWDRPIYLQPADEQDDERNAANVQAVLDSCMKHGYTLQLQIHKLLGVE